MIRKIAVTVVRWFLKIKFNVKIVNYDRFAKLKSGCIVAPNHISIWETVIVPCFSKRVMYIMAKAELFEKNRLFKWFLLRLKTFPVKRGKSDLTAIKTSVKLLRDGNALCMFPQGTRVSPDEKLKFKPGVIMIAQAAKVPILPVGFVSDLKFRSKAVLVYGEPVYFTELYDKKPSREEIDVAVEKLENAVQKAIDTAKKIQRG